MIFTKRFYKTENNRWYIDLPEWIDAGGGMEELEMVLGADQMLDILSNQGDKVVVQFGDEYLENSIHLIKSDEDEAGATYLPLDEKYNFDVWLCNVTLLFFENFPSHLYFKKVNKEL